MKILFLFPIMFYLFFSIRFNETSSMPIGFYRKSENISKINTKDIVAVCLPLFVEKEGLIRGYLKKGNCPGGSIPVLKKVIAVPKDFVVLTDQEVIVDGIHYFYPRRNKDSDGRVIKQLIKDGNYCSDGYWLYGSNDVIHSWDSRYYGPVARENIIGVYRPILTF